MKQNPIAAPETREEELNKILGDCTAVAALGEGWVVVTKDIGNILNAEARRLENAKTVEDIWRIQGGMRALRMVLEIPSNYEALRDELKAELEEIIKIKEAKEKWLSEK